MLQQIERVPVCVLDVIKMQHDRPTSRANDPSEQLEGIINPQLTIELRRWRRQRRRAEKRSVGQQPDEGCELVPEDAAKIPLHALYFIKTAVLQD